MLHDAARLSLLVWPLQHSSKLQISKTLINPCVLWPCSGSPQLPAIAKRAMQSLLGFGYLLTVLHEKHLGGHIQFTASAITGGSSGSTPSTGNSHMRTLRKFSSNGRTGMLKGTAAMRRHGDRTGPASLCCCNISSDGRRACAHRNCSSHISISTNDWQHADC